VTFEIIEPIFVTGCLVIEEKFLLTNMEILGENRAASKTSGHIEPHTIITPRDNQAT
jgi:hypothetical protein